MRKTIRSYACIFSFIAALAVPLSADTTTDTTTGNVPTVPGDFLTNLTTVALVFDAVKVVMPPG